MNCKPGDLARTVAPFAVWGRDRIVKVIRPARQVEILRGFRFEGPAGLPAWVVEGNFTTPDGEVFPLLVIADDCLRPIRDPGDDAQDETLAWKPVPLPTIQPELLDA